MKIHKKGKKGGGEAWGDWQHGKPVAAERSFQAPVRQAAPPPKPPVAPPVQPTPVAVIPQKAPEPAAGNTTVSINIQLPKVNLKRLKRVTKPVTTQLSKLRVWWGIALDWAKANRGWSIIGSSVLGCLVVAAIVLPQLLGNKNAGAGGSGNGSSSGGNVAVVQPDFDVVVPKSKPQLAKTDGTKTTFDVNHDSYSYSDTMQNYGFVVSQQPIPSKFASGQEAVDKIAPTVVSVGSQQKITTDYGTAYVITNTKNSTQTVVASVKKVLIFIQVSHIFAGDDWISYINNLQ